MTTVIWPRCVGVCGAIACFTVADFIIRPTMSRNHIVGADSKEGMLPRFVVIFFSIALQFTIVSSCRKADDVEKPHRWGGYEKLDQ